MSMNELKNKLFRREILRNLNKRRKWGASHTHYKHALSGLSRVEWGSKEAKRAVSDLVKEGKIMIKKTIGEPHISLNPRLIKEIQLGQQSQGTCPSSSSRCK